MSGWTKKVKEDFGRRELWGAVAGRRAGKGWLWGGCGERRGGERKEEGGGMGLETKWEDGGRGFEAQGIRMEE